MSDTSKSMAMGIPAKVETMKQYMSANHSNATTAIKMVGLKSISKYSSCVLECMAECAAKRHEVIPAKQFYYAILTLEGMERSRIHTEIEDVIKSAANNLICQGSTEVKRDAAACLAVAEMCENTEENPSLTPGSGKIKNSLVSNLKKCGIHCRVVPNGAKTSLTGNQQVNSDNEKNLLMAMVSLGVVDENNPVVIETAAKLQKSPDVISINDISKQLVAYGIKTNPIMALIIKDIARKSLGTIWPVGLVWPPFELGTGTGGKDISLGSNTATSSGSSSTATAEKSVAQQLLEKAVGIGLDLAKNYTQAQIDKMTSEADSQIKQLMSSSTGVSKSSITDKDLEEFAEKNKAKTDAIIAEAAKNAKIALDAEKEKNRMITYAGIGVGALLLVGVVVLAARK
jgi:hypothetical protein